MKQTQQIRAERNAEWIEECCCCPNSQHVRLTAEQCAILTQIYDEGFHPVPISGQLAAFLVLLHIVGPEARRGSPPPKEFAVDLFSLWSAASPVLREHLIRDGDRIICHELSTCWSAAA